MTSAIYLLLILFCFADVVVADDNGFKLIIIIVIPTLAITSICIVCVVIGFKKTRNSCRKWWNTLGSGRDISPSQLENADPEMKLQYNIAQMNQYLDVKMLADQFKKDKWEIQAKNLLVHDDCLGNGAFACVFRGTLKGPIPLFKVYTSLKLALEHTTADSSEVAVKKLPAHANHEGRIDFFHEMQFMKQLGYHPHVISMLGCVSNPIEPLIVVEYCKHGDLLRFLRMNKNSITGDKNSDIADYEYPLKIKDLVSIAWQVSDGLFYLCSHKFIHRDVAARNILLTKGMCAKISDFGLCRYADSALYTAKGGRLPIKWMAPESLKYYEYTEKTEIWSFSILLFEMFSLGEAPFPSVQPLEMISYLELGNRMRQPFHCPNEIYSIMKSCWEFDKDKRPTFDEVRTGLSNLLNMGDEQYGYLALSSEGSKSPMASRQLTFLFDECPLPDDFKEKDTRSNSETDENRSRTTSAIDAKAKEAATKKFFKEKRTQIKALLGSVETSDDPAKAIVDKELLDKIQQLTRACDDFEANREISELAELQENFADFPTTSEKEKLQCPLTPIRRQMFQVFKHSTIDEPQITSISKAKSLPGCLNMPEEQILRRTYSKSLPCLLSTPNQSVPEISPSQIILRCPLKTIESFTV